jgi:hypothetical protein
MSDENKKWTFSEKTPEELRQIGADIYEGKVFTDRHISKNSLDITPSIFLLIALGAFSKAPEEYIDNIGMIYEYLSEAGPRSINGYPMFFSLQVLSEEQAKVVINAYLQYKEIKENFVSTGPSGTEL